MNRVNQLLIAALVGMLLLSACGQKGALYPAETVNTASQQDQAKKQ